MFRQSLNKLIVRSHPLAGGRSVGRRSGLGAQVHVVLAASLGMDAVWEKEAAQGERRPQTDCQEQGDVLEDGEQELVRAGVTPLAWVSASSG